MTFFLVVFGFDSRNRGHLAPHSFSLCFCCSSSFFIVIYNCFSISVDLMACLRVTHKCFRLFFSGCPLLKNEIGNGTTLRNETQDGEVIYRFHCNSYFYLNGSSVISCLRGQWNGSTPSCLHGKDMFSMIR